MIKIIRDNSSISFKDELPIFAQKGFLQSKSDNYGWITNENFIISFIIDQRIIFKRFIFTSPIIAKNKHLTLDDQKNFIENVCTLVKEKLKPDFIAAPLASTKFSVYPEQSISTKYWTYIVDLKMEEQEILKKFNTTTRYQIRKSIRNNFVFSVLEDVNILANLLQKTFQRSGEILLTPSLDYIKSLIKNLSGNVATYQVSVNNEIQGVALVTYTKERAYYYYGASIDRPIIGSLPFLHWNMMLAMKAKGVHSYDFMGAILNAPKGTKDYGITRFKKRFGAVVEEGYIFKLIYSPFKYRLFNLLVSLAYRFKGGRYHGDVIDRCIRNAR